jgi:serine/threonine protein kinase
VAGLGAKLGHYRSHFRNSSGTCVVESSCTSVIFAERLILVDKLFRLTTPCGRRNGRHDSVVLVKNPSNQLLFVIDYSTGFMSTEFLTNLSSGVGPVLLPPFIKFGYWRCQAPYRSGRWLTSYLVQPLGAEPSQRNGFLLKAINRGLSEDGQQRAIERLARRVMLHDAVQHRGMPPVLDAELDLFPFFVVEPFLSGEVLSRTNYISTLVSTLSQRLWIARQLAEIVNAAHHRGHAHLGLSPHKIMVDHKGEVTVMGWSSTQRFGQICGLPNETLADIMARAPETFVSDYRAQPAADIYALGAILYWLFTKAWPIDIASTVRPPKIGKKAGVSAGFWERQLADVMHKQQTQIPNAKELTTSNIPARLSRLILLMLEKNPLQRPTMESVLDQLVSIEIDHLPGPLLHRGSRRDQNPLPAN